MSFQLHPTLGSFCIMEQQNLFDAPLLEKYKVGDFVSFEHLNKDGKKFGFIERIYSIQRGENRKFLVAMVMKTDGTREQFALSYLRKESS